MDRIVDTVAPKSKLIGMIALFAAAGFTLIGHLAAIGGGFMPVVGSLIYAIFNLAVMGIIPLLIVLKKDSLVKYAAVPVFAWWIINRINDFVDSSATITSGVPGVVVAASLFQFLIGCAMLVSLAFGIVFLFKKQRKWLQLSFVVFAGSLVLFLIAWALVIAVYASYDAGWVNYIYAFSTYLFMPIGVACVLLYILRYELLADIAPAAKATPAAEAPVEESAPVEETPVEEVPAEDAPVEETSAESEAETPATDSEE